MSEIERKFKWCLKKGNESGLKHRGIRKVKPDYLEAEKHIEKALHNLKALQHNIKGGFRDWAISAAFYAMYHSLLAVLYRLGYESRNQECTITAIEYFIKQDKIKLDTKYIAMVRSTDDLKGSEAQSLREEFQYGTEVEVADEIIDNIMNNAQEMVEASRICVENIK